MRLCSLALGLVACGASPRSRCCPLAWCPTSVVSARVRPLLPEGAVSARSASRASVGLGADSILAIWAHPEPRRFEAGVIADGTLHPFPALHDGAAPDRIGGVLLVQADADAAGEVVILPDQLQSRPDRNLGTARQAFEAVVVDLEGGAFVRDSSSRRWWPGSTDPTKSGP